MRNSIYAVRETVFIAVTGENIFDNDSNAPVSLALCDIGEEKTTARNHKPLQIFIEIPKLASRAEAKCPERRAFFEKFAVAMTRMPECEEAPDDFGDSFFEQMFEAADTKGYAPSKVDKYKEAMMSEFKIQATLAEAKRDALQKGREEGLAEGEAKGILETAKKFKAKGIPSDVICSCTGLTTEQVAAL